MTMRYKSLRYQKIEISGRLLSCGNLIGEEAFNIVRSTYATYTQTGELKTKDAMAQKLVDKINTKYPGIGLSHYNAIKSIAVAVARALTVERQEQGVGIVELPVYFQPRETLHHRDDTGLLGRTVSK